MKDTATILRSMAVAVALLPVAVASVAPAPALAARELSQPEAEEAAEADIWEARVNGTGTLGLRVRSGPATNYPSTAMLTEGSRVDVLEGPTVDRQGREWYRIAGGARGSVSGWAAGSYLLALDGNEPEPSHVAAAGAGQTPRSLPAGRSFTAKLTAYAHGTRTASGTPVRWGVVAVDPKVIPLGSRIMVEGFDNVFIAEDTGGGVHGNHLDIYFPDVPSALAFGVQYRVVTVLN